MNHNTLDKRPDGYIDRLRLGHIQEVPSLSSWHITIVCEFHPLLNLLVEVSKRGRILYTVSQWKTPTSLSGGSLDHRRMRRKPRSSDYALISIYINNVSDALDKERLDLPSTKGDVVNKRERSIRVLLADDHPVARAGIRAILEDAPGIDVVDEASNGADAKRLVERLRPDILLLDLRMPGPRPSDIARWIRDHCPETTTLVLTSHDLDRYLVRMTDAGSAGFLIKDKPPSGLVRAIRRAARGETLYEEGQLRRVHDWRERVGRRWESLTDREREALSLLAGGYSNRQIAWALGISEYTVETHTGNILGKLGVVCRTEAAAWVWEHGFAEELGLSEGDPPRENGAKAQ